MNIQQLREVHEVARHGLKISSAAAALYKARPCISRQLKEIENELGVEIFRRSRILRDIDNLKQGGEESALPSGGALVVTTTHTHARLAAPAARVAHTHVKPV